MVKSQDGTLYECRIRGKLRLEGSKATNPVAVGDVVDFSNHPHHGDVIERIHERRNHLVRRSTNLSKQTHVLAANIDQAVLVATLFYPKVSLGFLDRFLVTAEAYDIPVSVVFNKSDLWNEELTAVYDDFAAMYRQAGYAVYRSSTVNGDGLAELRTLLAGKLSLFSGFSGVGKSTLLNSLYPALGLRTGELSDFSQKGKHTTTFAEMHEPEAGVRLIDTPGIKELGVIDLEGAEIAHHFPEFRPHIPACKFYNCTHQHEPGCAIKAAVDAGTIAYDRYKSYLSILNNEDQYN